MFELFRPIVCVLTLAAVVLAAALTEPELTRDMGLPMWNLEDVMSFGESQGSADLHKANCAEKRQSYEQRDRIIRKVLGGGTTFIEAAAAFQRLNKKHGLVPADYHFSAASDEELACRQVICWVKTSDFKGAELLARRFEDELQERKKEQNGVVILPDQKTSYSE